MITEIFMKKGDQLRVRLDDSNYMEVKRQTDENKLRITFIRDCIMMPCMGNVVEFRFDERRRDER